ncbi:hypothetical protein [Poseidonocella sp. HB161398]|uniref:hypothetical protein n=1 Tax=Poseidonocella sp. HB161398 TaxID=2320855 RepID=UPI0011095841|nr:hypothetical protein [Poseidonocella sp. HB161398]
MERASAFVDYCINGALQELGRDEDPPAPAPRPPEETRALVAFLRSYLKDRPDRQAVLAALGGTPAPAVAEARTGERT